MDLKMLPYSEFSPNWIKSLKILLKLNYTPYGTRVVLGQILPHSSFMWWVTFCYSFCLTSLFNSQVFHGIPKQHHNWKSPCGVTLHIFSMRRKIQHNPSCLWCFVWICEKPSVPLFYFTQFELRQLHFTFNFTMNGSAERLIHSSSRGLFLSCINGDWTGQFLFLLRCSCWDLWDFLRCFPELQGLGTVKETVVQFSLHLFSCRSFARHYGCGSCHSWKT